MRLILRTALTAAAAVVMAVASATSAGAGAQAKATGTFYYSGLITGAGQINNPTLGPCYIVDVLSLSGFNDTDAVATVYSDLSCVLQGFRVDPGNNVPFFQYASVKFSAN
ncbi:hypothetical protein [Streptomyces liangshanensis]|uniref:Secreted protein n=1 Tax=Streptomyces liangshanensis TaxID=2717324 RepID=A0A6G9GSV4_9ACTN|nr:hypothetical protein [Streptomyces liangshanensis]QIQ01284.1 hypothetical protein HA039_02300 [Streptomyces liangshanensis]